MTQASGEKGWWRLTTLALGLALLGGAVRAESSPAAAWAFDLLARAEQWQSAGPLDFLPSKAKAQPPVPTIAPARIQAGYGRLPMHFEPNLGQTAAEVKFVARGAGYTLFLTADEAVLALRQGSPRVEQLPRHPPLRSPEPATAQTEEPTTPNAVVRMRLEGPTRNAQPTLAGLEKQPGISNYFLGNDPAKWRTHVPHYRQVKYQGVYPGIDMVFYGNPRQLEYDFVLAPGADPNDIRLAFEGVEGMRVADNGDLILQVAGGELVQKAPVVYQEVDGERRKVAGRYVLRPGEQKQVAFSFTDESPEALVSFQVASYQPNRPLVIDPVLVYSSYLGGNAYEASSGIAVDTAGNAYVTGWTNSSNFPTKYALYPDPVGSIDVFVVKLNASGTALVYATYLGDIGEDRGNSIAVDSAGNAYVTGYTSWGGNFPTYNALYPCSDSINLTEAFVVKLNASGTALVYSTCFGGSSGSDQGIGIAVDSSGSAYVHGWTNSDDLPTHNALYPNLNGYSDVFIAKLNPGGTSLVYSTYLGGSEGEVGGGIAVDGAGNAYMTGTTLSRDFPIRNALYPCNVQLVTDPFVVKLNASGTALVYSTCLGGPEYGGGGGGHGIAVDGAGNAYVTGETSSPDFPTHNALDPTLDPVGGYDAFVTKLKADGSALVYSTYLGGSKTEWGYGIAVDSAGNAYVTGETTSINFPTHNALDSTLGGYDDPFVTKLKADGSELVYSTYLGGGNQWQGWEIGQGIAVDGAGNAYVTGWTNSIDFPTTQNALYPNSGGYGYDDAFIAKIADGFNNVYLYSFGVNDGAGEVAGDLDALEVKRAFGRFIPQSNIVTHTHKPLDFSQAVDSWEGFKNEIKSFENKLKPDDTFILYISTHGNIDMEEEGDITEPTVEVDWRPLVPFFTITSKHDEMLNFGSAGHELSITDDEIIQLFSGQVWDKVNKLFIIDACLSGGFWNEISRLPKAALLASTEETKYATTVNWIRSLLTGDQVGRSYFSIALVQTLNQVTDNTSLNWTDLINNLSKEYDDLYSGGIESLAGHLKGISQFWGQEVPLTERPYSNSKSDFQLLLLEGSGDGTTFYNLTVSKSGGNGTVASTPVGINCGSTCTASFDSGTSVTLTANPDSGYSFSGWSGSCAGTGDCVVAMDADKNVTALFANVAPTTFPLTTATTGTGSGTVSGAGSYTAGAMVTLTAIPNASSTFAGWSPSPCASLFAMPANNLTCTATFNTAVSNTPTLTASKAGTGSGTVTGTGIHCGSDCTENYASGTVVTLTATPASGSIFAGWSGACSGTGNCTVTINAAKSVMAIFSTPSQPTVFKTAAGTISWFYAAAFSRTPVPNSALPNYGDIGGLAFWTNAYLAGQGVLAQYRGDVYAIADFFVGSAEFQTQYPASLTPAQFVTALYDNMLGRAPDEGGLAFWVGMLDRGESRGRVLADFTNSDENRNANPIRKAALESFIAFIDADANQEITPQEAAMWLAANPNLDGAIVD